MRLTPFLYRIAQPVRRLYWRIFKPSVFGVRVLITHPDKPTEVLLIRHTYGNREAWNIPGGGYNPKKETPEMAAAREAEEEVGLTLLDLRMLGIYKSGGEGKKDTVTMFAATTKKPNKLKLGPEIAEAFWTDYQVIDTQLHTSHVTKDAVKIAFPIVHPH